MNTIDNDFKEYYEPLRAMELQFDWDELIAKLPELNRSICQRLLAGQSLTHIAQELKINRRQVKTLACNALRDIALDYDVKVTDKVTDARSKACGGASPGQGGGKAEAGVGRVNGSPLGLLSIRLTAKKSKY